MYKSDPHSVKILLVGFVLSDDYYKKLEKMGSIDAIQTQLFSTNLIKSLVAAGATVNTRSFVPARDYPLSNKILFWESTIDNELFTGQTMFYINFPVLKHLSRFFSLVLSSRKSIFRDSPDQVLIYSVNSALLLYGVCISRFYKKPFTVVITDPPGVTIPGESWWKAALKKLDIKIVKKLVKSFDGQINVSSASVEYFGNINSLIVNGFVNPEQRSEENLDSNDDLKRIIYAGTLDINSGIDEFTKAFEEVSPTGITLEIYGSGHFENWLKKKATTNPNVRFYGRVSHEVLLAKYSSADLLIMPRRVDTSDSMFVFPSKLHEIMLTGTPVICTRLPAIPSEYFRYLIDAKSGSKTDFIDALQSYLSCSNNYIENAEKGKQYLLSNKTFQIQGERILEFLNNL